MIFIKKYSVEHCVGEESQGDLVIDCFSHEFSFTNISTVYLIDVLKSVVFIFLNIHIFKHMCTT